MSRSDYPLTDETLQVITNRQSVADEMSWNRSMIDNMVRGEKPDPFAYFKAWYAACVRAGVPYHVYDDALSSIRARYRTPRRACNASEITFLKLHLDAESTEKWIKALADGHFDLKERKEIRGVIERIRGLADRMEQAIDTLPENFER